MQGKFQIVKANFFSNVDTRKREKNSFFSVIFSAELDANILILLDGRRRDIEKIEKWKPNDIWDFSLED